MRITLLAAAVLLASPALALETPRPCSASDSRVRCVAYNSNEVVRLPALPGATLTVQFDPAERILYAGMSDNGLLRGEGASPRVKIADNAGTQDRNVMVARRGNFLFVKPLRPLDPQPMTVLTQREDGRMRPYTFQLETPASETAESSFYTIRFTYPGDEAAARAARAARQRAEREEQRARDRLAQAQATPHLNTAYEGQGKASDRALAPSAPPGQHAIWDDGQRTYLRYPGNHRVPAIFTVLPDGREGAIGHSANPDPETQGTLVVVHGVVPMLRLREGDAVLCLHNRGYDPVGRNPGTGTVSPDVVRETREPAHAPRR